MPLLKVNQIASYSGNTLTIGTTGDTITVASGVTFNTSSNVVLPAGAVGTPSLTTSGDTNTGIFFPAADTIAFTEGGTEAMRMDSSGNVLVGTTATRSVGNSFQNATSKQFFNELASSDLVGFTSVLNRNDSNALRVVLGKSRGTAAGGVTTVQNGDNLGVIMFAGADGTTINPVAAQINAAVDGTPGTNDMPGRLEFYTTADGASTPTERMRIDSSGNLLFNSGFGSVATAYGCRAWVNFNGTGTVAIRSSGNVSSITDGGTGIYTVNFTTAMPDANFSAVQTTGAGTGTGKLAFGYTATPTTTTYKILTTNFGGSDEDQLYVSVAIFR
jgi:hypothetical protein